MQNLPVKETLVNGDMFPVLDPNGKCYLKPFNLDGCCYYEVTVSELTTLINEEGLFQNALYKITDAHKNKVDGVSLYDDGTNSGTPIFIRAVSTSQLEKSGWGLFWNPKYNMDDYGDPDTSDLSGILLYNIWDGNSPRYAPNYILDRKIIWGGYVWTKYF